MKDDVDDEALDKCIALLTNVLDKCETRWSDGRTSVGRGEGKTAADFYMLGWMTSHFENPHIKSEKIRNATKAKLEACPNINRVMAPMKELCRAQIDALTPSFI